MVRLKTTVIQKMSQTLLQSFSLTLGKLEIDLEVLFPPEFKLCEIKAQQI